MRYLNMFACAALVCTVGCVSSETENARMQADAKIEKCGRLELKQWETYAKKDAALLSAISKFTATKDLALAAGNNGTVIVSSKTAGIVMDTFLVDCPELEADIKTYEDEFKTREQNADAIAKFRKDYIAEAKDDEKLTTYRQQHLAKNTYESQRYTLQQDEVMSHLKAAKEIYGLVKAFRQGKILSANDQARLGRFLNEAQWCTTVAPRPLPINEAFIVAIRNGNLPMVKLFTTSFTTLNNIVNGFMPVEHALQSSQFGVGSYLLTEGSKDPRLDKLALLIDDDPDVALKQIEWLAAEKIVYDNVVFDICICTGKIPVVRAMRKKNPALKPLRETRAYILDRTNAMPSFKDAQAALETLVFLQESGCVTKSDDPDEDLFTQIMSRVAVQPQTYPIYRDILFALLKQGANAKLDVALDLAKQAKRQKLNSVIEQACTKRAKEMILDPASVAPEAMAAILADPENLAEVLKPYVDKFVEDIVINYPYMGAKDGDQLVATVGNQKLTYARAFLAALEEIKANKTALAQKLEDAQAELADDTAKLDEANLTLADAKDKLTAVLNKVRKLCQQQNLTAPALVIQSIAEEQEALVAQKQSIENENNALAQSYGALFGKIQSGASLNHGEFEQKLVEDLKKIEANKLKVVEIVAEINRLNVQVEKYNNAAKVTATPFDDEIEAAEDLVNKCKTNVTKYTNDISNCTAKIAKYESAIAAIESVYVDEEGMACNYRSLPVLAIAVMQNDARMVEKLLDMGAKVPCVLTTKTPQNIDATDYAIKHGQRKIEALLRNATRNASHLMK